MNDITDVQLLTALLHIRRKAAAVRECRTACLSADPMAAHALTGVLEQTLTHAGCLEQALRRRRCIPCLQPAGPAHSRAHSDPHRQLGDLILEERVALVRQASLLRETAGPDAELLRRITEEEAVHLRLFRTIAGRL